MALAPLGLSMGLVMLLVSIFVGAFFLWMSAKVFNLRDKSYSTPLLIAVIVAVVGAVLNFIPIVGRTLSLIVTIVLAVWLVKSKYSVSWGKAILVWLIYYVLLYIVTILLALLMFGSMMAGLGMYAMGA